MKYITLHNGNISFGAMFTEEHRHRDIWDTLNKIWQAHPNAEDEDDKFLAPIHAGYVSFPGGYYDTFDRSTTLHLSSSPGCGVAMYKDFTSEEGGQFLMTQRGQFIALSAKVFTPEALCIPSTTYPLGAPFLLGDVQCRAQQGSRRLKVSTWVRHVPGETFAFGRERELVLNNLINCHSQFALFAGL